jgi:hypothetical protein
MAATKWRYVVGSIDPIGLITALSTANCVWISAQFGDDSNPGTPDAPVATYNRAAIIGVGKTYRVGSGYFYSQLIAPADSGKTFIGDGFCAIYSNEVPNGNFNTPASSRYFNMIFSAYRLTLTGNTTLKKCRIKGPWNALNGANGTVNLLHIPTTNVTSLMFTEGGTAVIDGAIKRIILSIPLGVVFTINNLASFKTYVANCIFYGVGSLVLTRVAGVGGANPATDIKNCYFSNALPIMMNGGTGTNEVVAVAPTSIANLRTRAAAVYGGAAADYFADCFVGPNPFLDSGSNLFEVWGDFRLNSTAGAGLMAQSMADDFGYVGAYNAGTRWDAATDWLSNTNLVVNSGRFEVVNSALDAAARGKIKKVGANTRDIQRHFFSGTEAPLNGIVLDYNTDKGAVVTPTGTTYSIPAGTSWVVESGNGVTFQAVLYTAGKKFRNNTGGTLSATDADGTGSIAEIIETPNKKTEAWRYSSGGARTSQLSTSGFVLNDWVYVISGSVIQGANTYNADDAFLYNPALTYTGGYVAQLAFNDSLPFKVFEFSEDKNISVDSGGNGNGTQAFNYAQETGVRGLYFQPDLKIESANQRHT